VLVRAVTSLGDSEAPRQCKARLALLRIKTAASSAVLVLMLAGCSVSVPLGSLFGADDPATGSVDGTAAPAPIGLQGQSALTPGMDAEDARRSQSALALALDPEGRGVPVNWDNPQSGSKGSFRSTGEFYLEGNQLCRRFSAALDRAGDANAYAGSACRAGPQNWVIIKAEPQDSTGIQR
jgi:surface antigen